MMDGGSRVHTLHTDLLVLLATVRLANREKTAAEGRTRKRSRGEAGRRKRKGKKKAPKIPNAEFCQIVQDASTKRS